ncbi:hypothetical protein SOV_10220 [Sporomusa ovata DSM 2662]|uniref:Uncharacterized protein n=1 Tax=Sporomusa ovata TaxID=2378 RepID=A0A0U1KYH2_9FIRM|nr:hypothetical protein [Sporomusa ovata]EQB28671.1 hypothetical protein SOV_1c03600 [Sporomusa ovata DSM 2662]CQR72179.1 hypothetical protein SpAn4DRAFT_5068 [Sporomusa ovata]
MAELKRQMEDLRWMIAKGLNLTIEHEFIDLVVQWLWKRNDGKGSFDEESRKVIEAFYQISKLGQAAKMKNYYAFTKLNDLCKDIEFGEAVLKICNGNITMVEAIKRQVKI